MIIFLADLQNSYYRYIRNCVPIGMGYVAAYIKQTFAQKIEIHLFRTFDEIHDAIQTTTPDLVAFGSYDWNTSLTYNTASYLKKISPDIITAIGGPNVSPVAEISTEDLRNHPDVDFLLPNEGEGPLRNLVQACLEQNRPQDVRNSAIQGCFSLDRHDGILLGTPISRFAGDLNEIPSPYLSGLMDRFLKDPFYLPIIQTARGCPYKCTFCVSGKDSWSKVRTFDLNRVKEELDYIAKHTTNLVLRLADENFGILPRDLEIAKILAHKHEFEGYPKGLSIYTDKRPTSRIKEIQLLLKKMLPFNISFQSMNPETLRQIKRINLSDKMIRSAVEYSRKHELTLVTEMIAALPGESFASFLAGVDDLMDYGFESIIVSQLRILKGTEQDWSSERDKHKIKTEFAMAENGYTDHPAMNNVELEEWVVATDSLREEEYFAMNKFIFLLDFTHGRRFALPLLFHFHNHDIKISELLMAVLENPETCPLLCSKADIFVTRMRELFHPTPEAALQAARQGLKTKPEEMTGLYKIEESLMIDILSANQLKEAIKEIAYVGQQIYQNRHTANGSDQDFITTLNTVCDLTAQIFIPLDKPGAETTFFTSDYDVASWVHSKYQNRLSNYRTDNPGKYPLIIRQIAPYSHIWDSSMSIRERFVRQMDTINSSNRVRIIAGTNNALDK